MFNSSFKPPAFLRNGHVQSIFCSSTLRKRLIRSQGEILQNGKYVLLDCQESVQLQCYFNQAVDCKATVILLHGWEGCISSNYMVDSAALFFQAGYNVFRLNFRDHGDTHHLNADLFHSRRIEEVEHAISAMLALTSCQPVYIIGYSLGGNFALRLALSDLPVKKIFAVSPAIAPANSIDLMQTGLPIYAYYFTKKWQRSLSKKQHHFPDLYNFDEWNKIKGLNAKTDYLIKQYSEYTDVMDYYSGYTLTQQNLDALKISCHIIIAKDDPVVPYRDFQKLVNIDKLSIETTQYGGHCAFIDRARQPSWLSRRLYDLISNG